MTEISIGIEIITLTITYIQDMLSSNFGRIWIDSFLNYLDYTIEKRTGTRYKKHLFFYQYFK